MAGVRDDYDLKEVKLESGDTETPFIALNPVHAAGLIYVDAALTITAIHGVGPDFRLRHLSRTGSDGEERQDQEVFDFPINGAALTLVPGEWVEIPEIVMKAARIKLVVADPGGDRRILIQTKS